MHVNNPWRSVLVVASSLGFTSIPFRDRAYSFRTEAVKETRTISEPWMNAKMLAQVGLCFLFYNVLDK